MDKIIFINKYSESLLSDDADEFIQDLEAVIQSEIERRMPSGLFLNKEQADRVSEMLSNCSKDTWFAIKGDEIGWKEWYNKRNTLNVGVNRK